MKVKMSQKYKTRWTHEEIDKKIEELTGLPLPSSLKYITKNRKIDLYVFLTDLIVPHRARRDERTCSIYTR